MRYIVLLILLVLLFIFLKLVGKNDSLFAFLLFLSAIAIKYYIWFGRKHLVKRLHSTIMCVAISYIFAFYGFFKQVSTDSIIWVFFPFLGNYFLLWIQPYYISAFAYLCGYLINYLIFFPFYDRQLLIYFFININVTSFTFLLLFITHKKIKKFIEDDQKSQNFINFVTHEIRVFLQGINMMLNYLTQNWANLSFGIKKSYFKIMETSLSQLIQLSTDILNLGNFKEVSENMNLNYHSITNLISEVIKDLQPFSLITGCNIRFDNKNPYLFYFDADKIKHVLRNLIFNALKYGNGLDINIHIVLKEDNNLIIKISDYGFGINEKDKENIFKPFWKGKNKDFDKVSSGYGLFLSSTFIKQHNGSIWVEENFPQGSIFCICLPFITNYSAPSSPESNNSISLMIVGKLSKAQKHNLCNIYTFKKDFQTLIVDDDLACLLSLKLILETFSHNVIAAQSFAQAIFLTKKQSFDLIFLDVLIHTTTVETFVDNFLKEKNHALLILQSGLSYDVFASQYAKIINLHIIFAYLQKPYDKNEVEKLFVAIQGIIKKD